MGNSFFLFLSDLFHQALFYIGGVFAFFVMFIEKIYKPIKKEWFLIIAAIFFFFATYQTWIDEHRNTQAVIAEKATAIGALNSCNTELRVQNARAEGIESLNSSLQNTIDDLQNTNGKQQSAVNSCVISLGKMNPIINTKIAALAVSIGSFHADAPGRATQYAFAMIITTNRQTPAAGNLKCLNSFDPADYPQLSTNGGGAVASQQPTRIASNEYGIRASSTGADWGPNNPIFFRVVSQFDDLGGCAFTVTR
jgi:hypothetical protein